MITIELSDSGVNAALARLQKTTEHLPTVLELIGEILVDSTKKRFATSTGPDGQRWAPNSEVTILRYIGKYKGAFSKKTGRLTKAGAGRVSGKKPLIGETGDLSRQIYRKVDGNTLYIGSSMIYSAAQHFGMKRGYAGSTKLGSPIPWGDIPARPFLGLSDQDRRDILATISDYLGGSIRP